GQPAAVHPRRAARSLLDGRGVRGDARRVRGVPAERLSSVRRMLAVLFYDVVKWIHIMAVVIAFGGAFTYPIWFRFVRSASVPDRVMFHRAQAFIGQFVISPGLLVIVLAGVYLASDRHYWSQVWV